MIRRKINATMMTPATHEAILIPTSDPKMLPVNTVTNLPRPMYSG